MTSRRELAEQGITIVFVTHEPDIALHTRRIIHIRDSRVNSDEVVPEPRIASAVLEHLPIENDWDMIDSGVIQRA